MSNFDSAWKEALDILFEPFMAFFFPEAYREIDWSRDIAMLDKELAEITRESEHGRRVVDKLAKVWRKNGVEEWVLVHIEVQSQPDTDFARRMFVYNYRAFDRYNQTVASFAILGDNRPGWRPSQFSYELWGTKVGIAFATAKLLDYAANETALESDPNPFATVVLAHVKTLETQGNDAARRVSLVRLVKGLYERGFSAARARQLYRLIDGMMALPGPLAELAWQEIQDFEQEKNMPLLSTAERVGIEKGLAEGLAQGREEGREEGRLETRRGFLMGIEVALELKFGDAGLLFLPEIGQIEDLAVLRLILESIKQAERPESLRRLWAKS